MGDLLDEDTKIIVIKKTWCHGQLIAPLYGFLSAYWAFSASINDLRLWIAALVMPIWSFSSWKSISSTPSYKMLLYGGCIVELCHLGIFTVAIRHTETILGLLMLIASILFFVETAAFLCVASWLRPALEQLNRDLYNQME